MYYSHWVNQVHFTSSADTAYFLEKKLHVRLYFHKLFLTLILQKISVEWSKIVT